jgi:hypothetical protein
MTWPPMSNMSSDRPLSSDRTILISEYTAHVLYMSDCYGVNATTAYRRVLMTNQNSHGPVHGQSETSNVSPIPSQAILDSIR